MFKRLSLLALVVALASTGQTAMAFDEIAVAGEPTQKGRISEIGPKEVVIDVSGRKITIPVNKIVSIMFDEDPIELKAARRSVKNGQYDMALEKLNEIDEADIPKEIIGQDIKFLKAFCTAKLALGGNGKKDAAYVMMSSFIKGGGSRSYHYYSAAETCGNLAAAMGEYDRAASAYGVVAKAPWEDFQLRAKVLEGQALLGQGKFTTAEPKFDDVLASPVTTPVAARQKLFAKIGKALCLAKKGQSTAGIKILESIIVKESPQDTPLFARTYNALGMCHGRAKRPKDALLAYLHVHILFYSDPEAHAESLYYLSKLWRQVNNMERAISTSRTLKERYAGSIWAQKD